MCKVQGWKVEGGIEMGMGGIPIGLGDSGCAWGGCASRLWPGGRGASGK
jgi:hypothetical protein